MSIEQKEKVATIKTKNKKTKSTQSAKVQPKEELLQDTSKALPKKLADKKIVAIRNANQQVTKIDVHSIRATSKVIYVDDIHLANPTVLQTIHWVIIPDTPHVVARVTEADYNMITTNRPTINHLVSAVDCSVYPMVSYGSWKIKEIKDTLPTLKQIEEKDDYFKKNPTIFHTTPVKLHLYKEDAHDKSSAEEEDEIDFEIDFGEKDEGDFDFSEDD